MSNDSPGFDPVNMPSPIACRDVDVNVRLTGVILQLQASTFMRFPFLFGNQLTALLETTKLLSHLVRERDTTTVWPLDGMDAPFTFIDPQIGMVLWHCCENSIKELTELLDETGTEDNETSFIMFGGEGQTNEQILDRLRENIVTLNQYMEYISTVLAEMGFAHDTHS